MAGSVTSPALATLVNGVPPFMVMMPVLGSLTAGAVGVVRPSAPCIEAITSAGCTVVPEPSAAVLNVPSGCLYTLLPAALVYTTGIPSAAAWLATSTVTMCLPLASVLADTVAPFLPTNSTSLAFFTWVLNAVPKLPVVLSELSTQPMLAKSPAVAALAF